MDWLHHPRFAKRRAHVLEVLRHDEYDFRSIKRVVFLCGAHLSPRRDALNKYFQRFADTALVFYAESVWAVISAAMPAANALEVEGQLADLADIVIILVESPGTFAELGAFANSERLRAKLLPILDVRHEGADSFLVTGPIKWVNSASKFAPAIWTDFDRVLLASSQIEERLARLGRSRPAKIKHAEMLGNPKHLLFFVCDLVSVFGPCPREHIDDCLSVLLGTPATADTGLWLALGKAMGILSSFDFEGRDMFFRVLDGGRLLAFQRKRRIDLPTLRSEVLSAMQGCEACSPVLAEFMARS